ncbi:MAG: YcxB family protein [Bacillota bacterium]|nr:YcxB family protein [Bacillota bacterium]
MEEGLKINVKLTENDLMDFALGKAFPTIWKKISFVISLIVMLFSFLAIFLIMFLSADGIEGLFSFPHAISLISIIITIFSIVVLSPVINPLITYINLISNYRKSNLLRKLQCYELLNDKINAFSDNSSNTLYLSDIYRINEYKKCFVIYTSRYKICIIPRRCFRSKDELDKFINICIYNIDNKKLKLKKYGLFISQPDYAETQVSNQIVEDNIQKGSDDDTLIDISYSFNIKEVRKMFLNIYYKSIIGKITTLIGIGLVSLFVIIAVNQSYNPIVVLILGLIFVLMPPISTYNFANKNFKTDAVMKKARNYKFKENGFICTYQNGESFVKWDELVKAEEVKSAILLYGTKRTAHIIPKRIFDDRKEELNLLRKIIKEKVKNAKIKSSEDSIK